MASAGNWFETERKAFKLRTKVLTTSATNTTYTARMGGAGDNFIIDRVIQVITTSSNNMAITVLDVVYPGQQLLVECTTNAGTTDNITTVTTTGDDGTTITGVSGWTIVMWIDDTNGWVAMAGSAT